MMKLTAEQHTRRLTQIVRGEAPTAQPGQPGGALESAGAPSTRPDDILHHVDSVLKGLPSDEVGDPAEFKKALNLLLEHADPALKKVLAPGPVGVLDSDELASLEALIIPDGSRPSFLLREGQIAANHPFLGHWAGDFAGHATDVSRLAACVGRIQLPDGSPASYSGTGTLVDAGQGLVLTNYHVVNHARNAFGVKMEGSGPVIKVRGDWVIDFDGESGSTKRNRWRIVEVRLPTGVGESFDGIDAAVLRIEPFNSTESKLPQASVVMSSDADFASGAAVPSLITIGFPGPPDTASAPTSAVNWNWVIGTLFNNRFGLKRVAPGLVRAGVGMAAAAPAHVLTHDATTFGGASGSLLFAWKDAGRPGFALHFAGATLTDNYAVGLNSVEAALRELGLTFQTPV